VDFFNLPNPSSRTMALGSTQPLTEMSTRNIPGGEGQPACKADNFTAICEPIVYKMWEPQHLTALWVSTAHYRDTFTFTFTLPIMKIESVEMEGKKLIWDEIVIKNQMAEEVMILKYLENIVPSCQSQWQCDLRHELPSTAQTLGSWVRIPLEAWMSVCVYSVFVLSSAQVATS
jgi:hypothetical protein